MIPASIELGLLTLLTIGVGIKTRWLGIQKTLGHHRTLLKVLLLSVMGGEAIVVVVRDCSHFRITRALRPVFILDNRKLRGVRRFAREVKLPMLTRLQLYLILLRFLYYGRSFNAFHQFWKCWRSSFSLFSFLVYLDISYLDRIRSIHFLRQLRIHLWIYLFSWRQQTIRISWWNPTTRNRLMLYFSLLTWSLFCTSSQIL